MRGLCVAAVAFVLAGCGSSSRSVLHAGLCSWQGKCTTVSDSQARRTAARVLAEWRREIARRAVAAPKFRFPNLSPATVRQRLDRLARTYDFRVVSVQFLRPRQLAPLVVVQTSRYEQLARATHAILQQIDPKRRTNDDRTGWRFEGFFFEAQDERGIPFLAADNFWRGESAGGGQWARSEPLYPFPHG